MEDPNDLIEVVNPSARDFGVNWDNVEHMIRAGEKKIYQRYIAEHICKHLTDREILKNKKDHDKLNDGATRDKWKDKIIVGVMQQFQGDKPMTEGERVARQTEIVNEQYEARIKALEDARPNQTSGKGDTESSSATGTSAKE